MGTAGSNLKKDWLIYSNTKSSIRLCRRGLGWSTFTDSVLREANDGGYDMSSVISRFDFLSMGLLPRGTCDFHVECLLLSSLSSSNVCLCPSNVELIPFHFRSRQFHTTSSIVFSATQ
eukprot:Protomagalhaensia_sp_Gyna_25__4347@NODE_3978_length_384_cov_3_817391_g3411_i0_p1_GENE_NODE_3978_length_384_cov_3_817391_g3411_i0NODE_3978_length_384_cov_3_817391_g3411_i0_p1_ORF_typecomplete_len118_score13_74EB/PF01683_18/0_091_NODE_3978_length_384_cov_3_817391_g3411_i015368